MREKERLDLIKALHEVWGRAVVNKKNRADMAFFIAVGEILKDEA